VEFVEFSPNENFMLTWNGATGKQNVEAIKLFDLKSGKCARAFPYTHIPSKDQWPNFKFSHDDKYFARVDKKQNVELISVFETSTCRLLDKKIHSSLGCDLVLVVPFREHHRILDTRTRKHSGTYYLDGVTLKNDSETESVVLCGEL